MYLRFSSLLITVIAAVMASGCCMTPNAGRFDHYPVGCETNCGECNDCGGGYGSGNYVPQGPFEAVGMWRRSLFHGDGCGQIYRGEWMSTPPAACDPCGGSYGGTRVNSYGHHLYPGMLLGRLYGKRLCGECGLSHFGHGCAEPGGCNEADCGCQEEFISEGEYIEQTSSARMATSMTPKRATAPPTTRRSRTTSVPSRSRITRDAGTRRVTTQQN
ncbi:MAG: hypothetical protein P8K79_03365 [Mariniblastus sp.]|nr:hypothetical protein [Mariniblastus sp.]